MIIAKRRELEELTNAMANGEYVVDRSLGDMVDKLRGELDALLLQRCVWREGGELDKPQCKNTIPSDASDVNSLRSTQHTCIEHGVAYSFLSPRKKKALRDAAEP